MATTTVWDILKEMNVDRGISEIMINGTTDVFVENQGEIVQIDRRVNKHDLNAFVQEVATFNRTKLTVERPILDGNLPDGSRVNIITGPYVKNGIAITIRQYLRNIKSFDTSPGVFGLSKDWVTFFKAAIAAKLNILVAGGTGAGKTTFLNLLLNEISIGDRVVTIEDTFELNCPVPNKVALEAALRNNKEKLTIRDLVKNALRMRPDRLILGEARGEEVFDLLQALNTGHEGSMSSIHANSSRDALMRLEGLFLLSGFDIPIKAVRRQIASGLDFVVHITRGRDGRRYISQLSEVTQMEGDYILMQDIAENDGKKLMPTGIASANMEKLSDVGLPTDFFNNIK